MDKKRSILNVAISITSKFVILILSILVRRFLIGYVGNEVNGLNSLYLSIIGILSVAELGVGTAISFSMYAPIVNKDYKRVSALFNLFKKVYLIIGGIILISGCALMPFLHNFAKDYSSINQNLYLTFGLMLISTVMTYCFSSKISLINAYKDNYVTTLIHSGGLILQYVLQILVLITTRSFSLYLLSRIVAVTIQWATTEILFRCKYSINLNPKDKLDSETKKEVTKNVKAMFMHKIGAVLVNSFDSVIISTFIGVVILGKYSNYSVIMTSMVSLLVLFFTPLTSIIGHLYAKQDKKDVLSYFNFFYGINYSLACVFFLGYYAVIDDLICIFFGPNLELSKAISFVITINYFTQFMRQSVLLFRDATGTFYYDRWKPVLEGGFNIVFSIALVIIFPEEYKVVGVIVATIITNLLICHVIEPFVLFKHAFRVSVKKYYIRNYLYQLLFVGCLFSITFIDVRYLNHYYGLFINGVIAAAISLLPILVQTLCNKDFKYYIFKHVLKLKTIKV